MSAPYNLACNSQWEICSALKYDTRYLPDGSAQMATANVQSYTVGTNKPVITVDAIPPAMKVGDCIKLTGGTAQQAIKDFPMRVLAINAAAKTITALLPRNIQVTSSGTSTLAVINIGCGQSLLTGDAADGWKKSTTTICWREDNSAVLAGGSIYALGLKKTTANREFMYMQVDARQYRGAQLAFGIAVLQTIRAGAGTWRAYIRSDVGAPAESAVASTTAGYQWREVSYHVPQEATIIEAGIYLDGGAGDAYFAANPVLTIGTEIGDFNYIKPREEAFVPVVKSEPAAYIGANIQFPSTGLVNGFGVYYEEDLHAASGLAIAPSVRVCKGNIEGYNPNQVRTGIGGSRLIAWADTFPDPLKLGNFLPQYATGVKSFAPARIVLNGNGGCLVLSGTAGDTWQNVSIDFDEFVLR